MEYDSHDMKFRIDSDILSGLGVASLRPQQRDVIEAVMSSKDDVFAILPTGSGKTLCFMYYILASEAVVIMIYPLISLMNDQIRRFKQAGIDVAVLRGGQTGKQRRQALDAVASGKVRVVITNPETLLQESVLSGLAGIANLSIVFDEAHVVVEWGETFRGSMLSVGDIAERLGASRILAFTATASDELFEKFSIILHRPFPFRKIAFSCNRENIRYRRVITSSRICSLVSILGKCEKPCIVFCNNRMVVESLAGYIRGRFPGFDVSAYHAGMPKDERRKIEDWYRMSGNAVLVATCAFGMGMDKSDIRTSVHFGLPNSVSAFLQESGRIGRDGNPSVSWTIVKRSEKLFCGSEARRRLFSIFSGNDCIRSALLCEMGEKFDCGGHAGGCSSCDVCEGLSEADVLGDLVGDFLLKTRHAFDENSSMLALLGIRCKSVSCGWMIPYFGALSDCDRRMVFESVREMHLNWKRSRHGLWSRVLMGLKAGWRRWLSSRMRRSK